MSACRRRHRSVGCQRRAPPGAARAAPTGTSWRLLPDGRAGRRRDRPPGRRSPRVEAAGAMSVGRSASTAAAGTRPSARRASARAPSGRAEPVDEAGLAPDRGERRAPGGRHRDAGDDVVLEDRDSLLGAPRPPAGGLAPRHAGRRRRSRSDATTTTAVGGDRDVRRRVCRCRAGSSAAQARGAGRLDRCLSGCPRRSPEPSGACRRRGHEVAEAGQQAMVDRLRRAPSPPERPARQRARRLRRRPGRDELAVRQRHDCGRPGRTSPAGRQASGWPQGPPRGRSATQTCRRRLPTPQPIARRRPP